MIFKLSWKPPKYIRIKKKRNYFVRSYTISLLPISFSSNSVACIITISESTPNSVIPKWIAEQRISNAFLNISEYFDGNADTYIISFSSIIQADGSYIALLPIVDNSWFFIGVVLGLLISLLSSSSLRQMTREIEK